jgi:hypothetical protein
LQDDAGINQLQTPLDTFQIGLQDGVAFPVMPAMPAMPAVNLSPELL